MFANDDHPKKLTFLWKKQRDPMKIKPLPDVGNQLVPMNEASSSPATVALPPVSAYTFVHIKCYFNRLFKCTLYTFIFRLLALVQPLKSPRLNQPLKCLQLNQPRRVLKSPRLSRPLKCPQPNQPLRVLRFPQLKQSMKLPPRNVPHSSPSE